MSHMQPSTMRVWNLPGDLDISVAVAVADDEFAVSGNVIEIWSEMYGCVSISRAAVDDLIAALRAANNEADAAQAVSS